MIGYQTFYKYVQSIKKFMEDRKVLDDVLKAIAPSGTSVCEIGDEFIDSYIRLLSSLVYDKDEWISWFIFQGNFGKKKPGIKLSNGEEYEISSELLLYYVCILDGTIITPDEIISLDTRIKYCVVKNPDEESDEFWVKIFFSYKDHSGKIRDNGRKEFVSKRKGDIISEIQDFLIF